MVICAVEGCGREKFARVWCSKHYQRWYHNGNPERPYGTHKSRACKAGECREKPYSKSATYCPTHSPVVQADELLTYSGAHQRVATKRGKASAHICAHCNAPAQEWAYDHADPDEKQSDRGSYSLDENHYISLCVSCHTKMDRKRILVSR